jgi:hypothetical protein
MAESRLQFDPSADLERALREIAPLVSFPPTPDLADTIRARIAAEQASSRPARSWSALLRPRRLAVAFLVLLLVVAAVLSLSPGLRASVANRLGVHGIEIIFVEETPTPAATPVGTTLLLGENVTLTEAQARAGYPIQIPAELGPPDEVYLRQRSTGPMVTLLYRPRPGLPEASETGVGALLMQFPASGGVEQIVKRITMGSGSMIAARIDSVTGFWVTGSSELVIAQDPSAGFPDSVSRPSANVLIWEENGMVYRLELDTPMRDAVKIAESLHPIPQPSTRVWLPLGYLAGWMRMR